MTHLLRFTPPQPSDGIGRYYAKDPKPHYFVRLGDQWPHNPQYRLIDETTPDITAATQFSTEEQANEAWARAGKPPGWEVIAHDTTN